jgi:predicted metal-dependent enzyme (double-stranded beta helix superfamily)
VEVTEDDWLDPACACFHPRYYQHYLLYVDPADRFSVVSFDWGSRRRSMIAWSGVESNAISHADGRFEN